MSTYTQILYQIVFSTKSREPALEAAHRKVLYKYMWGILKNRGCHMYQTGGVNDHIHVITRLHSSVALTNLIKDIKLASTEYIKSRAIFPLFGGW